MSAVLPARAAEPAAGEALPVRLHALAAAEYAREPSAGLSVAVVRNGRLEWTGQFGLADLNTGAPVTEDTLFRVGSVTKQFTALMLLQLVHDGTVNLSDPVERYLPEIRQVQGRYPHAPPVTLIQLATHTSGLAVESDDPATYAAGSAEGWEASLLAALPRTRYAFEPGTRYAYSNVDYAILGAALARAAKVPYVRYLHQRIFSPLGMTHTVFTPQPAQQGRLARGYVMEAGILNGQIPDRELAGRGYKVPGGGAFSTVGDLAKFMAFQMGYGPDSVLPRDVLLASRDLLVAGNPRLDGGYGVGFQVFPADGFIMQGHLGGLAGYRSLDAFDPGSQVGVIVLRNVSNGAIDPLALGGALIKAAREPQALAGLPPAAP